MPFFRKAPSYPKSNNPKTSAPPLPDLYTSTLHLSDLPFSSPSSPNTTPNPKPSPFASLSTTSFLEHLYIQGSVVIGSTIAGIPGAFLGVVVGLASLGVIVGVVETFKTHPPGDRKGGNLASGNRCGMEREKWKGGDFEMVDMGGEKWVVGDEDGRDCLRKGGGDGHEDGNTSLEENLWKGEGSRSVDVDVDRKKGTDGGGNAGVT